MEPVWKKYAARKRQWSERDRITFALVKENYYKVVEAVMEHGLTWRQAGINFELPENVTAGIHRRWKRAEKSMQLRRSKLAEAGWQDIITQHAKERLLEVVTAPEGITVEKYNQAKISQSHLKGVGIYKVGDSVTFNQQNNLIVSEEQAARILELERKAKQAIIETTAERAVDGGAEGNRLPDRQRAALVAAELHQDAEPALEEAGIQEPVRAIPGVPKP